MEPREHGPYEEGYAAYLDGQTTNDCPYDEVDDIEQRDEWMNGYEEAMDDEYKRAHR